MLKTIMSQNIKTLDIDSTLKDAAELMVKTGIRRVAVSVSGNVIGVISARTIIREALNNQNWTEKKVGDVTRPAIFVDADTSNRSAAKLMVKYGVGSLLVRGQGIVTERDIAKVIPRVTIPAIAVGTQGVVTLNGDQTVRDAGNAMISLGISHIPVVSGADIIGVVSLRDVLKAFYEGNSSSKLSDIVSKSVISEDLDATVGDVADIIATKNVGSVLLLEDNELKASSLRAIVTEWDLVRTYANMERAHVLVKADPSKIRSLVATLFAIPRVSNVAVTYGPYDLIVTVDVEDISQLGAFVINSIASLSGVKDTLTLIEAEQI
ncbi:MAG: CBS domain-containing protein [Candidatus Aramenus sulfurataquae]|jgi:CBS domain-containing protein|uniref:CBS domain-containing protein n=1 Tax=Candidatus Aramenus sulfurataquae TaxID=1326980 RepID=A0ACC6TR57_9CREN